MSDERIRAVVEAKLAVHPSGDKLTPAERELVAAALEGAASTVLDMLGRVEALIESSTTGMVSVTALRHAIAGTKGAA